MKNTVYSYIFTVLIAVCILLLFTECDSGDIYEEYIVERNGIDVEASFRLTGLETFPSGDYILAFGAFEEGKNVASDLMTIQKPKDGDMVVNILLEDISMQASTLKLSLATPGRQTVHTFFETQVNNSEETMIIEEQEINLNSYNRLQVQLFDRRCVSCHGTQAGSIAAELNLDPDVSLINLINAASSCVVGEKRVIPNDYANSILYKTLIDGNLLRFNHINHLGGNLKDDDLTLLREWISSETENN